MGDLFRRPCGCRIFAGGRKLQDRSVRLQRRKIDGRVAVQVRRFKGQDVLRFRGLPLEKPAPPVGEKMQRSVCVHERSVRISVAIEIPPGKTPQRFDVPEKIQGRKGAVAVVSEGEAGAFVAGQHQIDIALKVQVGSPDARERGIQDSRGQPELPRSFP